MFSKEKAMKPADYKTLMPKEEFDIIHCGNSNCPIKETCLRYTAQVHETSKWDFFNYATRDYQKFYPYGDQVKVMKNQCAWHVKN